jgi:glycosyltransferase involved in cell wall biosynthesis
MDKLRKIPGKYENRIICVANFKPQKDHYNLLRAFSIFFKSFKGEPHLLLAGAIIDKNYYLELITLAKELRIEKNIHFLGQLANPGWIMDQCSIGVLSSKSEGLPLALLEYGLSGLAPIVTNVGQCGEVIGNGKYGALVPPENPQALAEALISLMNDKYLKSFYQNKFKEHIQSTYTSKSALKNVNDAYLSIISRKK